MFLSFGVSTASAVDLKLMSEVLVPLRIWILDERREEFTPLFFESSEGLLPLNSSTAKCCSSIGALTMLVRTGG